MLTKLREDLSDPKPEEGETETSATPIRKTDRIMVTLFLQEADLEEEPEAEEAPSLSEEGELM